MAIFGALGVIPLLPSIGGTGVANSNGNTITLGGTLTTTLNNMILRTTGSTDVTFPVSGTLATTSQVIPLTNNTVVYVSNAGVVTSLALGASGTLLTSAGTTSAPTFTTPATSGTVTSVSGTANQVAVATGTSTPVISLVGPYTPSTFTTHGVLIGEATGSIIALSAGTAGQVLQSGGAGADPAYSTATFPTTSGSNGNVLTSSGGNWVSSPPATSGTVTSVSGTANQVSVATGTTTPVISLVGPYSPATYSAHGLLVGEGTSSIVALATGSSGQVLQSGGAAADPVYSTATYPSTAGTANNVLTSDGTNWISQASAGAGLQSVQLTLTNAQIKNLFTTPVQLISAPGAGKVIILVNVVYKLNYGGTNPFTASGGQYIGLSYVAGALTVDGTMINAAVKSNASNLCQSQVAIVNYAYSNANNLPITLVCPVAPITGNAANNNTITVNVIYYIATI